MKNQGDVWDKEYKNPKLVTKKEEPQADTRRFLKYLKKNQKYTIDKRNILDLGSGTGRNSNYLANLDNNVIGIEISKTALLIAKERDIENLVDYRLGDIGKPYDIKDNFMDIVLDITSSNSLDEKGREVHLKEARRVLKEGGYFFLRALAKEGNKNVKNLLKMSPGKEKDTYMLKEIGLTERVFSKNDLVEMYSKFFKILKLEKKMGYTTFNNRIYKRGYYLVYMQK